jgi:hypothetical protein
MIASSITSNRQTNTIILVRMTALTAAASRATAGLVYHHHGGHHTAASRRARWCWPKPLPSNTTKAVVLPMLPAVNFGNQNGTTATRESLCIIAVFVPPITKRTA